MKLAVAAVAVLALVAHDARPAHAIAACAGTSGFSPHADTVPPRAQLLFYADRVPPKDATIVATIDDKPVAVKVTPRTSGDGTMLAIAIDSDRAGTLKVTWKGAEWLGTATYRVDPKLAIPKTVHGTLAHFHHQIPHSTVREVWDGLAIEVDAPATELTIRWRRDAQTPWSTLEVPAVVEDGHTAGLLGELGCHSNFTVPLLAQGLDLEVSATLANGSTVTVADVPAHAKLP